MAALMKHPPLGPSNVAPLRGLTSEGIPYGHLVLHQRRPERSNHEGSEVSS